MQSRDETDLIEGARTQPELFAELYRRYLPRVYRYLYVRLGSQCDAEDITSQVFLEALQALRRQRYREDGCFPAWLFTIVRRRLMDFHRRHPEDVFRDGSSGEPDVLYTVEAGEDAQRLSVLLSRLGADKQELLRLRFAAGLSIADIAALEHRSAAAVKMALHRTLAWLREQWAANNE